LKLSIVTTLYQSAPHLIEFYQRATSVAQKISCNDYEIILVNDGSPDNSLDLAIQLTEEDSHVILVDLSRNFGHHKAMMTGLAEARGDKVFLIDSDLEEQPECLISFSERMAHVYCDVVYGVQEKRKGGFFEQWTGSLFWSTLNKVTGLNMTANVTTARLMSRRYVDALLLHTEREVFMAGLWHITGFDQRSEVVHKSDSSVSTYSLRKKMSLLVNAITSFSNAPLVAIFYIGVSISIITGMYICYLIAQWLFLERPLSGWTSLMASIWLIGGLIMSFIGVVGIYLSKIFSEAKQRPYTIIRQIYGR
jgi:putative glycosyltransferase